MRTVLCVFLVASFFDLWNMIKNGEKKEATIYMVILVMTVSLAVYLIMNPEFVSFSRIMLDLVGVK